MNGVLLTPLHDGLFWACELMHLFYALGWDGFRRTVALWNPHHVTDMNVTKENEEVVTHIQINIPISSSYATFTPGMYYFLCAPEISSTQWHPFSVSEYAVTNSEVVVSFHIKSMGEGSWSHQLAALQSVGKGNVAYSSVAQHETNDTKQALSSSVYLDGPFGSLSLNINPLNTSYSTICIICGGIGITPMLPVVEYLINSSPLKGGRIRSIELHWVVRGVGVNSLYSLMADRVHATKNSVSVSRVEVLSKPAMAEEGAMELVTPGVVRLGEEDVRHVDVNDQQTVHPISDGVVEDANPISVDTFIYNTRPLDRDDVGVDKDKDFVVPGRPDVDAILSQLVGKTGASSACVLTCGPAGLAESVGKACSKHGVNVHKETFG